MPSHRHAVNTNINCTGFGSQNCMVRGAGGTTEWKDNGYYMKSTGGGQAHNNLQPYIVQNFIIKAKQSAGLVANVVDNLTSTSTTNALSANQGKVLNEKIDTKVNKVNGKDLSTNDFTDTYKTKLDGITTYSTNEIKTGETWIDGKPIYKKTYTFTTTSTADKRTDKNIDVSALKIDNFINVYGSLKSVGGTMYSLERCEGENLFTRIELNSSKTTLQYLTRGQNKYYGGTATMTIRYTKTTD